MCKEKYIYLIKDNLYRIKIVKKDSNIYYDKYFHCDLKEAIKTRDEILKNNNISLKGQVNEHKSILIEKYIYKTTNNKYRLFIRSGNYYYSKTFNNLLEARKERKIKMSEKTLINNKKIRNDANLNEFVDIWFSIYCFKELKTTTSYSMMNVLNKYVLKELGSEKISNITSFKLQNFFSDLKLKYSDISDKTIYRIYKVRKIGFSQMLSLYTNKKFTLTKKIEELYEFVFNANDSEDYKQSLIVDYVDKKYPIFKKIDISNININNVLDWLKEQKEKYGDEFMMISLI